MFFLARSVPLVAFLWCGCGWVLRWWWRGRAFPASLPLLVREAEHSFAVVQCKWSARSGLGARAANWQAQAVMAVVLRKIEVCPAKPVSLLLWSEHKANGRGASR